MSHYAGVTYEHVEHTCRSFQFLLKIRRQEFLTSLGTNQFQDLVKWLCKHIVPQIWASILDDRKFTYVWCLEWTSPGPEFLYLNQKLVNFLTQFLFWVVTVQFTNNSNHCHVIFRGVVLLHKCNIKLDYFKNDTFVKRWHDNWHR